MEEKKVRKPRAKKPLSERHIYGTTTAYIANDDWEMFKKKADEHNLTTNRYIFDVLMKDSVPYKDLSGIVWKKKNVSGKSRSITGLPEELKKLKEGAKKCGVSVGRYIVEVLLG